MCLPLLLQPPEGEELLYLFTDTRWVLSRGDDPDLPGFQRAGDCGCGRRSGRGSVGRTGHGESQHRSQREPAKRPGHHFLSTTVSAKAQRRACCGRVWRSFWVRRLHFLVCFVFVSPLLAVEGFWECKYEAKRTFGKRWAEMSWLLELGK